MLSEFIQKKRIGTLLLEKKLVTQEQLEWALIKQRESKCMLGEILVEAGFISEDTLCKMLALQFGVPFISESEIALNEELMGRVPENLLKMKKFIPLKLDTANDILTIIISDPNNFVLLDHVKNILKYHVKYVLASASAIEKAVTGYLSRAPREEAADAAKSVARVESAPAARVTRREIAALAEKEQDEAFGLNLVNSIVNYAYQESVGEIHFEPLDTSFRIRFRLHGALRDDVVVQKGVEGQLVGRLKILAGLDFSEKKKSQRALFALERDFLAHSCELITLPGVNGEGAVLKLHDVAACQGRTLEDLGMDDAGRRLVRRFMMRNRGLAIVAGPQDSGRTATLGTFLRMIDQSGRKNMVLQSRPVSLGVMAQYIQVGAPGRIEASAAWRDTLFTAADMGADALLVDGAPFDIFESSLVPVAKSGRSVVATLTTGASAADLLHDLVRCSECPEAFVQALSLVVVERLVPLSCQQCRKPFPPGAAKVAFEEGGLNHTPFAQLSFVGNKGCPACSHRGVTGRKAIFEVLEVNEDIRALLSSGASAQEIRKKAGERGMKTLKVQLLERARRQEATLECLVAGLVE